jgi:hypothetical protein
MSATEREQRRNKPLEIPFSLKFYLMIEPGIGWGRRMRRELGTEQMHNG